MDDRQLRSNLIRLAHQHPELREQILPVLKEAGIVDRGSLTPAALDVVDSALQMKQALAVAYRTFLRQWAKSDMYLRDWNQATKALVDAASAFGTDDSKGGALKQAGDITPEKATDELGDIKTLLDRVADKAQRLYNRLPDNGAGVREVWKSLEAIKTAQALTGEVIDTIDLGNYQGRF